MGQDRMIQILVAWVLMTLQGIAVVSSCNVQSCSETFMARTHLVGVGAHYQYCVPLRDYMKCIEDQAKACHGDIMFHGNKISVETLLEENRCEEILAAGNFPAPGDDENEAAPTYGSLLNDNPCWYKGSPSSPAYCGLFGDPHLKTFNGTFMTCRVRGAWPMLSSSHLAIQVTNEAVAPDYKATATTKVTVIIKSNTSCGSAKTYEASGDSLPRAFVDGTTFSGPDKSRPFADVVESRSGHHVLINVRSINAVVSIRKVGSYLSVSVTLPEEVVQELVEDIQLCVGGCPRTEQLMESSTMEAPLTPAMSEKKALSLCLQHNITDYYLDSCVFDLVTTGDLTFREAAALSLKDMWTKDPKASYSIRNCSSWPCVWRVTSGHGRREPSVSTVLMAVFALGWVSTFVLGVASSQSHESCTNS